MIKLYDLKGYKSGRRTGLTAAEYKGPHLLHVINPPSTLKNAQDEMPPKTYPRSVPAKKAPMKSEPDVSAEDMINALPESSSEEEDVDIKPTAFGKRPEEDNSDVKGGKVGAGGNKAKKSTVSGKGTSATRNENAGASPSSSSGSNSTKRKSESQIQKDRFKPSGNMVDPYGRMSQKKKPKTIYGSNQSRQASSQSALASQKAIGLSPASPRSSNNFVVPELFGSPIKSQSTQNSPTRPAFLIPDDVEESLQKPRTSASPAFCKPDDLEESPRKPKTPAGKLEIPDELEHTPISTPGAEKRFKNPGDVDSPAVLDINGGGSFTDLEQLAHTPTSTPPSTQKLFQRPANAMPRRDPKQLLELKKHDLGEDLASRVEEIFGQDGDDFGVDPMELFDDDLAPSITASARCPMCNQQCDATELKKWGAMNTRQQERFCRSHRRTTAEKKWYSKGYPKIDWEKLDSRISEHRNFIEDLLNGGDCRYRRTFEEMVAAGKGRSLRRLESNLTPGYYGSRGLNTISEYVIREFSGLLSKRSVEDPLMSKRGTTAFVQSVIVPEVAVQLIIEDMSVDDVEARDVLTESANIGELVNEEIRDVIEERVENSEDEDDEG